MGKKDEMMKASKDKEDMKEGEMPAGLKKYLDKKNGKEEEADKEKKDVKEVADKEKEMKKEMSDKEKKDMKEVADKENEKKKDEMMKASKDKEDMKEGEMPAGLKKYLDKKNGKEE